MNVCACLREDGKKINYYQFFQKSKVPEFLNAVGRQVPNIPMEGIRKFIQNIEYLSEQRKEFYHKFLSFRYEKILFPAYKRQMRMEKKKEKKKEKKNQKVLDISWKEWYSNQAVANSTAVSTSFFPFVSPGWDREKQIEKIK